MGFYTREDTSLNYWTAMTKPLLLTIDGMNVFRRVYGANPAPDSPAKAQGSIRSSSSSLERALREHQPTHVALVMDVPGPNWRHALYPAYKAGRKRMPQELSDELYPYLERLRSEGWFLLEQPGVEADDSIGSLAREAELAGVDNIILSTDKDIAYLAQHGARVYNHFDYLWHDAAWVLKKFGVRTAQLLDLLALTGDASDGIPGIEKVGVMTAAKLLSEYGDLETVLANASNIKGKVGERLREQADIARLSRKLTHLKTDLLTGQMDWDALTHFGQRT